MIRFIPVLSVMLTIFLLSHTPGDDLPSQIEGLDKLCHATAYGALAATAIFAMLPWYRCREKTLALLCWLFCILYGFSDEFHQSFTPGRFPSMADIIADGIGAGLIIVAWLALLSMKSTRMQQE